MPKFLFCVWSSRLRINPIVWWSNYSPFFINLIRELLFCIKTSLISWTNWAKILENCMNFIRTRHKTHPHFQKCTSTTHIKILNLEMSIRFSLKSRPSERFHRSEMSQIKVEISLCTNVKLIFHKNVECQWYQWIPWFL